MATDLLDIVMASYNPAYTDEHPALDYALEKNAGVILKKILASGHVDKLTPSSLRANAKQSRTTTSTKAGLPRQPNDFLAMTAVESALKFAFDHKAVHCAIIGTINPKHLKENVAAYETF